MGPPSIASSDPVLEGPSPRRAKVGISRGRGAAGGHPRTLPCWCFIRIFVAFSFKQLLGFLSRSRRRTALKEGGRVPL